MKKQRGRPIISVRVDPDTLKGLQETAEMEAVTVGDVARAMIAYVQGKAREMQLDHPYFVRLIAPSPQLKLGLDGPAEPQKPAAKGRKPPKRGKTRGRR